MTIALSRTCNLADFPDCLNVGAWQQRLAQQAWALWEEANHIRTREQSLCVNRSALPFVAPGPEAIYLTDVDRGIERQLPAIYGLNVLDHTEAPVRFLTRSAQRLRPGGLLFLTFAIWNAEGPDCATGADERKRIYDLNSWRKLVTESRRAGFQTFGGMDWTYHGHQLAGDHSLASLVLSKRNGGAE